MLIARGVARGVHIAGSLSILGTLAASLFVLPGLRSRASAGMQQQLDRTLGRLVGLSLIIAVVFGFVWFFFESMYVSDANNFGDGLASLIPVIRYTNFGHLLIVRIVLLSISVSIFATRKSINRNIIALSFAVLGTALQAGLGHGAAMGGIEGAILLAMLYHLT